MKLRKSNPMLIQTVFLLRSKSRETGAKIWRDVAERLSKPRRNFVAVNLSRINRYTQANEMVIVAGKVLGAGRIDHPVQVAAFSFSSQARRKITEAKGVCLTIPELVEKNPRGSHVKIIG